MQRVSKKQESKYIESCLPVLKAMHAAIGPKIQADESLLDKYDGAKMMIKVLADAGEIDALYYCGLLTDKGYAHCQAAVEQIKAGQRESHNKAQSHSIAEPPSNIVQQFLGRKNDYVPFTDEDADLALMVQGAAQLMEILYYNRLGFKTDLRDDLIKAPWYVSNNIDYTTYLILFNMLCLTEGLKDVLPDKKISVKSEIILKALTHNFYQGACETLYAEAEARKESYEKAYRKKNAAGSFKKEELTQTQITIGLKKSERMMAAAYYFGRLSGANLMYSPNRQIMLLSGLIHSMRTEIERADFSKLFKENNPHREKLGPLRQRQVLKWFDAQTAPFLKTVHSHVQKGVNNALKSLGTLERERN